MGAAGILPAVVVSRLARDAVRRPRLANLLLLPDCRVVGRGKLPCRSGRNVHGSAILACPTAACGAMREPTSDFMTTSRSQSLTSHAKPGRWHERVSAQQYLGGHESVYRLVVMNLIWTAAMAASRASDLASHLPGGEAGPPTALVACGPEENIVVPLPQWPVDSEASASISCSSDGRLLEAEQPTAAGIPTRRATTAREATQRKKTASKRIAVASPSGNRPMSTSR